MEKRKFELNEMTLQSIAMFCMVLDHMWATVMSQNLWMNCLGRLTFPIFAFTTVEGYFHTKDFRGYIKRLLLLAVISEIPFNLINSATLIFPFHQNVIWTFIISLLCIHGIEKVKAKGSKVKTAFAAAGLVLLGFILGFAFMTDFFGTGVLMILVFYFFRGRKWYHFLGQVLCLYWVNVVLIKGMDIPLTLLGHELFFPVQGIALFALIPIWLYRGKQGPNGKAWRWFKYGFYPAHMLILYGISWVISAMA